jgi:outer membrane receptor for ferrienterochelin and colicins
MIRARTLHRFAVVALALSTFASTSRADDAELAGLLDENIVTTASKASEVGSTAPATSSVITAEEIRVYGMHTIGEAIDFLGLGATGGSTSSGTGFGVRGVHIEGDASAHVLVLIDGHAVNDFMRGGAPLGYDAGIPIELVDHIELVLGPGSVLYGSHAMLAVVNVITKRASAFHGVRVGVESDLPSSARGFAGVGHEFVFLGAPSELTIAAEYRRSNGPGVFYAAQDTGIDPVTGKLAQYGHGTPTGIWGGGRTANELLEEPAVFGRFVSGNFEATVRATSYKTNERFGFAHFDDPANRIIQRRFSAELRHHAVLSPVVQINTRLYADSSDEQVYFETSVGQVCPRQDVTCAYAVKSVARWAGLEVQSTLDWLKDASFVTLVGIDPRIRSGQGKTDSFAAETGAALSPSTGVIDRTDAIIGAYLQQTWRPAPWLGLNGGMRLDYDARFHPVVSPRLAASANVWRGGVLKAVYSEAFRAPSFNDSFFSHPLQPTADLHHESVRSAEVSIEQSLGAHRLLLGMFKSTWTDLIQLHAFTPAEAAEYVRSGKSTLAPLYQYENDDRIESYGFNAGFEGSVASGRLRYGANVTGALSKDDDTGPGAGMPLTTSPRVFGNARFSYTLPKGLPTIGVAGLYVARAPTPGAYDGGYPTTPYAPAQVTLRTTLSGDAPLVKGLSYRITASYQFADRINELAGPFTEYGPSHMSPTLRPITQLVTTVGLQYQF